MVGVFGHPKKLGDVGRDGKLSRRHYSHDHSNLLMQALLFLRKELEAGLFVECALQFWTASYYFRKRDRRRRRGWWRLEGICPWNGCCWPIGREYFPGRSILLPGGHRSRGRFLNLIDSTYRTASVAR